MPCTIFPWKGLWPPLMIRRNTASAVSMGTTQFQFHRSNKHCAGFFYPSSHLTKWIWQCIVSSLLIYILMKTAVIKTGGKQYVVSDGQKVCIGKFLDKKREKVKV